MVDDGPVMSDRLKDCEPERKCSRHKRGDRDNAISKHNLADAVGRKYSTVLVVGLLFVEVCSSFPGPAGMTQKCGS
jgi:hypothetical protein